MYYCESMTVVCICWLVVKNRVIMHGMDNIKKNELYMTRIPEQGD